MSQQKRNPVRIRFKFNKETGEIEDFIVDDNSPDASENYHDRIATLIAGQLGVRPTIEDAGPQGAPVEQKTATQSEAPHEEQEKIVFKKVEDDKQTLKR